MIHPRTIKKIGDLIQEREDFQETLNTKKLLSDDTWLHTYNVVTMNTKGELIIMSDFCDNNSNSRQFLVYNIQEGTLRDATEEEDDEYREIDDENPFMEGDQSVFIICRNADDTIDTPYKRRITKEI